MQPLSKKEAKKQQMQKQEKPLLLRRMFWKASPNPSAVLLTVLEGASEKSFMMHISNHWMILPL